MKYLLSFILFISNVACAIDAPVPPVTDFQLDRYLGKWYEIARLDNKFEDGLENITAEYALRDDGGVSVTNKGYVTEKQRWKTAKGRAYFVEGDDIGFLKVTFFWPFYGAYVIFELDHEDYQYAFVAGPDTSYLWFLSRTPAPDEAIIQRFIQRSAELGFDTDKLIFVDHSPVATQ